MPDPQYIVMCDGDAFGFFDTDVGALAWLGVYALLYSPKIGKVCRFTSPPPELKMPNEENKA